MDSVVPVTQSTGYYVASADERSPFREVKARVHAQSNCKCGRTPENDLHQAISELIPSFIPVSDGARTDDEERDHYLAKTWPEIGDCPFIYDTPLR